MVDPQKFPGPTKISGVDKNFRDRPKFPGSTKISGTDQNFRGRQHFSRGRIWEKIGYFGSSKLSKCTPSNVLVGVHKKTVLDVYWGGIGFWTKMTFLSFFWPFCQIFWTFSENSGVDIGAGAENRGCFKRFPVTGTCFWG